MPTRLLTDTVITLDHRLVLFVQTQLFDFELEKANQPGFEPGSHGHKAATLSIGLHSSDFFPHPYNY